MLKRFPDPQYLRIVWSVMKIIRNWTTAIVLVLVFASAGLAKEVPPAKPEAVGMSSAKLAKVNDAVQKMPFSTRLKQVVKPLVYQAIENN